MKSLPRRVLNPKKITIIKSRKFANLWIVHYYRFYSRGPRTLRTEYFYSWDEAMQYADSLTRRA